MGDKNISSNLSRSRCPLELGCICFRCYSQHPGNLIDLTQNDNENRTLLMETLLMETRSRNHLGSYCSPKSVSNYPSSHFEHSAVVESQIDLVAFQLEYVPRRRYTLPAPILWWTQASDILQIPQPFSGRDQVPKTFRSQRPPLTRQ